MKRKLELLNSDVPTSDDSSTLKKNNIVVSSKRGREFSSSRQCWADEDVDCGAEVVKKGYCGNRRVIYNFIKIDVSKVPTYIL